MFEIIKKSKFIFLPGGPNISGDYLDSYLKSFPGFYFRLSYLNHEKNATLNCNTSYKLICEDILNQIHNLEDNNYILVGHSYGGLIALELLHNPHYHDKIIKTIIVSTPFSKERSQKFQSQISHIHLKENYSTDMEFTNDLQKILHLYFFNLTQQERSYFIQNYYLGNEASNLTEEDFLRLKNIFISNESIESIFGMHDLLVKDSDVHLISNRSYFISNSGHFPMLENPEEFTKAIETLLKKHYPF